MHAINHLSKAIIITLKAGGHVIVISRSVQGPSDDEEVRTDGKHGRVLHGG